MCCFLYNTDPDVYICILRQSTLFCGIIKLRCTLDFPVIYKSINSSRYTYNCLIFRTASAIQVFPFADCVRSFIILRVKVFIKCCAGFFNINKRNYILPLLYTLSKNPRIFRLHIADVQMEYRAVYALQSLHGVLHMQYSNFHL